MKIEGPGLATCLGSHIPLYSVCFHMGVRHAPLRAGNIELSLHCVAST